ncbi:hypothetical protein AB0I60_11615 [Actinosynnema sp. NPDC050436]|uniref:hypothetical protein n=1 Tax=Actinosynnema sp. NPDC050436 TaxID=3155659 RepID=UPI0033ED145B
MSTGVPCAGVPGGTNVPGSGTGLASAGGVPNGPPGAGAGGTAEPGAGTPGGNGVAV